MSKIKILTLAAAFLLVSPLAASASGNGGSNSNGSYYDRYYDDNGRNTYYGSNIPGPSTYVDYQNTIPWFNPPYEAYQYKLHALPNGDVYFSTPGNNYLPYISSGYQPQPFDYGSFTNNYYQGR